MENNIVNQAPSVPWIAVGRSIVRERSDNTTSYFFLGLALTMVVGWTAYQCKERCVTAGRKHVKFIQSDRQRYKDLEDPTPFDGA